MKSTNLSKLKENQTLVSIQREAIDENKTQGFILAFSKRLILIQYISDFRLDGLMVLRRSDISCIESTETDLFQTQILKEEGLFSQIKFTGEYLVEDWPAVFSTIVKESVFIILENEAASFPVFLIGKIQDIGDSSVSVLCFDGEANWDDELTEMNFDDISAFQAGDNYSLTYQNYFQRNQ